MRLADFPLRGSRSSFQQPGPAARVVTLTLGYGWKRKGLLGEEEKRRQDLLCNDDKEIRRPRGLTPRARGPRRRKERIAPEASLPSVSPGKGEEREERRSQSVLALRSRTPEEWKEFVQKEDARDDVNLSRHRSRTEKSNRHFSSSPQKKAEERHLPALLTSKVPRSMLPEDRMQQVQKLSGKNSMSVIFDSKQVPVLYKLRRKRTVDEALAPGADRRASVVQEKSSLPAGVGSWGAGGGGHDLVAMAERRRELELERRSVLNDLAHNPQDPVLEIKKLLAKSPSSRFRYDCLKLALLLDFPSLHHLPFHRLAEVLKHASCHTVQQGSRNQLAGVGFLLEGEVVEFIVPAAVSVESIEDEHVLQLAKQRREATLRPLSLIAQKVIRQERLSITSHLTWSSAVDQVQPHLLPQGSLVGVQRLKNEVESLRHHRAAKAMQEAMASRHAGSVAKLFTSIDLDNSQSLEEEEVVRAFRKLGVTLTREEVKAAAKRADVGARGSFSLAEFEALLESMLQSEEETSRLLDVDAFRLFFIVVSPSASVVELPINPLARAQLEEEEDKLQAATVSFLKEEGPLMQESSATLAVLASSSELRYLSKGETLYAQGSSCSFLFILVAGEVALSWRRSKGRKGEENKPSCLLSSHELLGGFSLQQEGISEEATETAAVSSSFLHFLRIPVASLSSRLPGAALSRIKEMLRRRKQNRDELLHSRLGSSSPPSSPLPESLEPPAVLPTQSRRAHVPRSSQEDEAVAVRQQEESAEEMEEVSPSLLEDSTTKRWRDSELEQELRERREYETLLGALKQQEETLRHEEEFASVSRSFLELFNSFKTEEEICRPKLNQAQIELRKYRAKRAFNRRRPDGSSLEDLRGFHVLMERVKDLDNSLNHLMPVVKQMRGMVKHREDMEKRNLAYELFASASLLQAERTMLEYLQANPLTPEEEEEGDALLLSLAAMVAEGSSVGRVPSEHVMVTAQQRRIQRIVRLVLLSSSSDHSCRRRRCIG